MFDNYGKLPMVAVYMNRMNWCKNKRKTLLFVTLLLFYGVFLTVCTKFMTQTAHVVMSARPWLLGAAHLYIIKKGTIL